jgi:hypothetical protein
MASEETAKPALGWREWVNFEGLGLPPIKAKVDTGARTSTLHAFKVRGFTRGGRKWVRFRVHPLQRDNSKVLECEALVLDQRPVTDSGGHTQKRYVIECTLNLQGQRWPIELTLTNRDNMLFRALLGRTAIRGRYLVDPGRSFTQGGGHSEPPAIEEQREEE